MVKALWIRGRWECVPTLVSAYSSANLCSCSRADTPGSLNNDPDSASRSLPEPNVELVWSVYSRLPHIKGQVPHSIH